MTISTIASNVIEKVGGTAATAKICECSENWVFKWRLTKDKGGTGGLVPRTSQEKLLSAASRGEIELEPQDFFETFAA